MNRRKTKLILASDEEDEEDIDSPNSNSVNAKEGTPRSSQRLKRKSERRSFVLPSRKEIWDAIPSVSSDKSISKISPKRTVNNFTKVYNSYNYDEYEDSSHDDSDGFITDSSENDLSSNEQNKKRGRIKNFKRRIKPCSSSDEGGPISNFNTPHIDENKTSSCDQQKTDTDCSQTEQQGKCKGFYGIQQALSPMKTRFDKCADYQANMNPEDESDSDVEITPAKRRRNMSILVDSESDSSNCSDACKSQSTSDQPAASMTMNTVLDSGLNDHPTPVVDIVPTPCSNVSNTSTTDVIILSNSSDGSTESGESDSDSESESEIKDRSVKFKRKKEKLFQKFKDIQKLRKTSKQNHTPSDCK